MTALGPLILDLEGTRLQPGEKALVTAPEVGGVILFARNFESRAQLIALVDSVRALRPNLLLAVDQEGGRVQRFKDGFTRLPPMQAFYEGYQQQKDKTLALVENAGWLMAVELLACGIDFSFAPVLDLDTDHCVAIADRAFADDADAVIDLAGAFMRGMHAAGMATTGKHFPGHGSVRGDSHKLLPEDPRAWAEIESRDLRPFAALSPQLDAVMPAHILFPQVDSQPVGFSGIWLQKILRQKLGFTGVVFSDDLSMEGASAAGGYAERASAALSAGCDMVLACNNPDGATEILEWLRSEKLQTASRAASMVRRQHWHWPDVEASPRWKRTVSELKDLLKQKNLT